MTEPEAKPPLRSQAELDAWLSLLSAQGREVTEREALVPTTCSSCSIEVLHLDDDYLVIGKPPDVRMDGNFDVTVVNLVRHWVPAVADKDLKWVHQLDFATSGVLCIGLNKRAAARACQAFQEFRARKVYLAVVEGVVDPSSYQIRSCNDVNGAWGEGSSATVGEGAWGKKRTKKGESGVQHKPTHSFFVEEQQRLLRSLELGATLTPAEEAVAHTPWGRAKHDPAIISPFLEAAARDKERAARLASEAAFRSAQGAPDLGVFQAPDDGPGTFRVDASIVGVPGDFRMEVCDSLKEGGGGGVLRGKSCKTLVQVLETGHFRGRPVTKLLLRPQTGRRHQLRLHTRHAGHPILGDATYAHNCGPGVSNYPVAPRMCLHAHSLCLKLVGRSSGTRSGGYVSGENIGLHPSQPAGEAGGIIGNDMGASKGLVQEPWEGDIIQATATDPFPFVNGELILNRASTS
ncbi:unnamed protein product [Choristocarpus tenellus]